MERPSPDNPFDIIRGREHGIGPLIGSILILAILAAGAIYFAARNISLGHAPATATSTTIIIYRTDATSTTATGTVSSTGNAELDAIQENLYAQTAAVDGLNF